MIDRAQSHRRIVFLLATLALTLFAVACGSSPGNGNNSGPIATAVQGNEQSLSVFLMARDIEVADQRLPILVLLADENTTRLDDRLDDLSFAYRHIDDAQFKPLPEVVWRAWPVRGGAYTGAPEFDRRGTWEVQVKLDSGDGERVGSAFLQVEQDSSAPSIGESAPLTVSKTASTVEEVEQISSAFTPDPRFYAISLDEALTNGRPTVVLFSTPAFCETQTCGPQLEVLGDLMEQHGDAIDFIHVEIFDNIREMLDTGDSSLGRVAQPVTDWNLITEPWTFFVDSDGIITARFEQFTTFGELSEATERLLAAG